MGQHIELIHQVYALRVSILNQVLIYLKISSETETAKQIYSEIEMLKFMY